MPTLANFQILYLPPVRVIGREIRYGMDEHMNGNNRLPAFWETCFNNNLFAPLEAIPKSVFDPSYVGLICDWERGDGEFSYVVGMRMIVGTPAPAGYVYYDLNPCKAAIAWITGPSVAEICSSAHEMTLAAGAEHGVRFQNSSWNMELYNCPRFTTPDADGNITLDYIIPVD